MPAFVIVHGFERTSETDAIAPHVEQWFEGDRYETLAICRTLALARFAFKLAIAEEPAGRIMIRSRTRVVQRYPQGDW
jgi:hypothetical protein